MRRPTGRRYLSLLVTAFVSVFVAASVAGAPAVIECARLDCNAYECWERLAGCRESGYMFNILKKYCRIFKQEEVTRMYDAIGQEFLVCVHNCHLQKMLNYMEVHIGRGSAFDCETLDDQTRDIHVDCQLSCGYCEVCRTNKIAGMTTIDVSDVFSFSALTAAQTLIKECGLFTCF